MSHDSGANPLRWDCSRQGCFNLHKRPKIELFADCLPGRLAFSDVDAIAEVNGNFLVLEWKEHRRVPTGQRLLYERWTAAGPTTVLLIVGDAREMTVDEAACVHGGTIARVARYGPGRSAARHSAGLIGRACTRPCVCRRRLRRLMFERPPHRHLRRNHLAERRLVIFTMPDKRTQLFGNRRRGRLLSAGQ